MAEIFFPSSNILRTSWKWNGLTTPPTKPATPNSLLEGEEQV